MSLVRYGVGSFDLRSLNDGSSNWWTNSGVTSGEYYYNQTNIERKPMGVYANNVYLAEGILGTLVNGEWAWGDQDSIGASRLYVKLAIGDPDAQLASYVKCSKDYEFLVVNSGETLAATSFMISNSGSNTANVYTKFMNSSNTTLFEFTVSIPAGYSPFTLNERFILTGGDKVIINSGVNLASAYLSGMGGSI